MSTHILILYGGWEGHTPHESAERIAGSVQRRGARVTMRDSLSPLARLSDSGPVDAIVPIWTMGRLSPEEERGLTSAIEAGVGLAGFHAMCDAFRESTAYQFMCGGQFVAHPGNLLPSWRVRIRDREHPITRCLDDFDMKNTERYYLHVDPTNHLLADTRFEAGFDMPVAWTRSFGRGRVFYASVGHTHRDFEVPEALELATRGILWSAGALEG